MEKKRSQKGILIAALVLVVAGAAVLVFSGVKQSSVYFLEVSEALAMGTENLNQARLFGIVGGSDIQRPDSALGVRFNLMDKEERQKIIRVDYTGVVPDTFKPGVEVIVEGNMRAKENVFAATTLLTKCPSKYKKKTE